MPRSSLSLPHHQGVEVRLHGHSTRWCAPCQPGTWGPGYGLSEEALTPTAEFFPVLVVVGFPSGPAIILSDFEGPELRSRWSDREVLWCVGKLKAPASPWAPDRHRVSRGFPAVWPGGRQAHHHSSHDSRCSSKCPGLFLSTQVPAQAQSVRPGGGAPRSRGLSEPQTRAHVQWSCPEEAIQGGSLDRPGSSEAEQAGSPFPSVEPADARTGLAARSPPESEACRPTLQASQGSGSPRILRLGCGCISYSVPLSTRGSDRLCGADKSSSQRLSLSGSQ